MSAAKLLDYTVNFIMALLMSFSFIYALTSSLEFLYKPYFILLLIFIALLVYSLIFLSRLTLKITGILLGGLLVAGAATALAMKAFGRIAAWFVSLFYWLYDYIMIPDRANRLYPMVILIFLCAAVTLGIYLFTFRERNFYVVLISGIVLFSSQWMMNYMVTYVPFYIFAMLIPVYYFRHIHGKDASRESDKASHLAFLSIWASVVSAGIFIGGLFMPSASGPLEWKWLDTRLDSVYDFFERTFDQYAYGSSFSLASTGFGGGALGGKVRLDKTPVLQLHSVQGVYLKGTSSDYYTGSSWVDTDRKKTSAPVQSRLYAISSRENEISYSEISERQLNLLVWRTLDVSRYGDSDWYVNFSRRMYLGDSLSGTYNLSGTYTLYQGYGMPDTMDITYLNLKTRTVFIPLGTDRVDFSGGEAADTSVDSNGNLALKKAMGSGFKYEVEAQIPKPDNAQLEARLRGSSVGAIYDAYSSIINEMSKYYGFDFVIPNADKTHYAFNETIDYSRYNESFNLQNIKDAFENLNEIYSKYLQLPENLPQRVRDLAKSVTKGKPTNYDKVRAIETYLAKTYPYTLSPDTPPRNRDFVDYFLFDGKEGYCTYYASAMAVMVRSLGIPAKYVEGYVTPVKPDKGNRYKITNEQAHAWVEVYFEGYGWVPFEPTAPFTAGFYHEAEPVGAVSSAFADDPANAGYLDSLAPYNVQPTPPVVTDETETSAPDASKPVDPTSRTFLIIMAAVLIPGSLLSMFLAGYRYRLSRYHRLEPNRSMLKLYGYYINMLRRAGYPIKPGETPYQYSERIDRLFGIPEPNSFRKVTGIFAVSRYSCDAISMQDRDFAFSFNRVLQEKIRQRYRLIKYLIFRR